ncbi:MAG: monofunctional biosynthetic peptidoglycan transglycosylase [bacterium]
MPKIKKTYTSRIKKFFFLTSPLLFFLFYYQLITPNISKLKRRNPQKTALMNYRERIYKQKGKKYKIKQKWVTLSRISPHLINAILIAEDDKFWQHDGFDYEAIQEAIDKDIEAGKFKSGGSTISQQLVKNLYLSPKKSLIRKLREAIITWRIEKTLSKKRILELYLNVIEWGEGIFGIEAAARYYYNKSSYRITPFEAARLAAVLPNPIRYKPTGKQKYVINRSQIIYDRMMRRKRGK